MNLRKLAWWAWFVLGVAVGFFISLGMAPMLVATYVAILSWLSP